MINREDYIEKVYFHKTCKRNRTYRLYRYICDKCGKKKGYYQASPSRSRNGDLCASCRAKGRIILDTQRQKIRESLIGRKHPCTLSKEKCTERSLKATRTKKEWDQSTRDDVINRSAASKLGLSLTEYLSSKEERKIRHQLAHNMRSMILHLLRGRIGQLRHIPWTINQLKVHLESRFALGMTWGNYGRKEGIRCWEIDHVIPICAKEIDGTYFWKDLSDPISESFIKCWSLENLQPMWADENNRKNNKWEA